MLRDSRALGASYEGAKVLFAEKRAGIVKRYKQRIMQAEASAATLAKEPKANTRMRWLPGFASDPG